MSLTTPKTNLTRGQYAPVAKTVFASAARHFATTANQFLRRALRWSTELTSNPSLERTHTGKPLQAPISFWALRVLSAWAAQLKRWASEARSIAGPGREVPLVVLVAP